MESSLEVGLILLTKNERNQTLQNIQAKAPEFMN